MHIANKHNIHVIEDACHAYLAKLNKYWQLWNFWIFQLPSIKNLNVGGDGGMIVTNSKNLLPRLNFKKSRVDK